MLVLNNASSSNIKNDNDDVAVKYLSERIVNNVDANANLKLKLESIENEIRNCEKFLFNNESKTQIINAEMSDSSNVSLYNL